MQFDNAAFVRDTAEQGISSRAIEDWHLSAIRQANFVMLHAPDGYIGLSAATQDIALRRLVNVVPSVYDVLCVVGLR